jgi:hypothetical protein
MASKDGYSGGRDRLRKSYTVGAVVSRVPLHGVVFTQR